MLRRTSSYTLCSRLQLPTRRRWRSCCATILTNAPEMYGHQERYQEGEKDYMANIETHQRTLSHGRSAYEHFVHRITNNRSIRREIGADSDSPDSDLVP